MRVWIAFLLLSFIFGARAARRGRENRTALVVFGCLVVSLLLNVQRLV